MKSITYSMCLASIWRYYTYVFLDSRYRISTIFDYLFLVLDFELCLSDELCFSDELCLSDK